MQHADYVHRMRVCCILCMCAASSACVLHAFSAAMLYVKDARLPVQYYASIVHISQVCRMNAAHVQCTCSMCAVT